ncbi:EVE domain-containing protein [Shewanella sp. OMA3-2]|uniref:EVE domain-containing protein n=1 Tax=Shewanella sp. OMA3-2 TaxID=2908650 RepID=UPI001F3487AD|nr:EVE domain-containing protein [Shewanella sp. OMA3-2]UJF20651.1 EVE domain-containing protein [Shewanella sp. OMA3-2]
MKYWLMKSEPDEFSIDDLQRCTEQKTAWQGIRNYQARNFLRDQVSINDLVLFYHSSCKVPAIVGLAKVSQPAQADSSAFEPSSPYFDLKSDPNAPRWVEVELTFIAKFVNQISLKQLKADVNLADMMLVTKGARLSVQPVKESEFNYILSLCEH